MQDRSFLLILNELGLVCEQLLMFFRPVTNEYTYKLQVFNFKNNNCNKMTNMSVKKYD